MAPPCRATVSCELRFGFAGAKPKLGVRWVAHFQLILLRVQLGFASCLKEVEKLTAQDASVLATKSIYK